MTAQVPLTVEVAAREAVRTPLPVAALGLPGDGEFLVADVDGLRAVYFPVPDREFPYPRAEFDVRVEPVAGDPDTVDVVVTAHTLVRDLLLQPDRLAPDAVADTGLVTLLPGEEARIRVDGWSEPDAGPARAALFCVEPA